MVIHQPNILLIYMLTGHADIFLVSIEKDDDNSIMQKSKTHHSYPLKSFPLDSTNHIRYPSKPLALFSRNEKTLQKITNPQTQKMK